MNLTTEDQDRLIAAARKAAENAYAPYSNYPVGAAVLTENKTIFCGCNVENASYGLTICAERTAIFQARCSGHKKWIGLAIYAPSPPAPLPCGACRQVIAEGGNKPKIIVVDYEGTIQTFDFEQLFPHPFEELEQKKRKRSNFGEAQ